MAGFIIQVINSYHFPNGFISILYCFPELKTNHFAFQGANLFWLGWDFYPLIPSESEILRGYLWRRAQSRDGEMEETHDLFVETFLPGSRTTGGNLFCPHASLRFWSGKKLLGSANIKRVIHWLIIWSDPAKMIERSKESSRNAKGMSHSSFLTARLRIMMLCLLSQWLVVLQDWGLGSESGGWVKVSLSSFKYLWAQSMPMHS